MAGTLPFIVCGFNGKKSKTMLPSYYLSIPSNVLNSLFAYSFWGDKDFGGFVRACLENDLQEAFSNWDGEKFEIFHLIVRLIHDRMPSQCWGGARAVRNWNGLDSIPSHICTATLVPM